LILINGGRSSSSSVLDVSSSLLLDDIDELDELLVLDSELELELELGLELS
jgi:hypothetical protein